MVYAQAYISLSKGGLIADHRVRALFLSVTVLIASPQAAVLPGTIPVDDWRKERRRWQPRPGCCLGGYVVQMVRLRNLAELT